MDLDSFHPDSDQYRVPIERDVALVDGEREPEKATPSVRAAIQRAYMSHSRGRIYADTDGEAVIMLAFHYKYVSLEASGRGSTPLRCIFFSFLCFRSDFVL